MEIVADCSPPEIEEYPANAPFFFDDDCIDGTTIRFNCKDCQMNNGAAKPWLQVFLYFLMGQAVAEKSQVRNAITESALEFAVIFDAGPRTKQPSRKPATLVVYPMAWRDAVEPSSHQAKTMCNIESLEHLAALALNYSGGLTDTAILYQTLILASLITNEEGDMPSNSTMLRQMIYEQTNFALPPFEEMGRGEAICKPQHTTNKSLAALVLSKKSSEQDTPPLASRKVPIHAIRHVARMPLHICIHASESLAQATPV